jgi:hypothetical protein
MIYDDYDDDDCLRPTALGWAIGVDLIGFDCSPMVEHG